VFDSIPSWGAPRARVRVVGAIPDVNLIAMGAAGYRFGDYWRLGIDEMAVFFVVSVFVVPQFWRL
jgi:hypothetical protein